MPGEPTRAETLMGRRRTDPDRPDLPAELGYWCPVCQVPAIWWTGGGDFDQRLHWSEYEGFLWCDVCERDYPSALCVPLDVDPDRSRPWVKAGPDAAVDVFLDSVEAALDAIPLRIPISRHNPDGSIDDGTAELVGPAVLRDLRDLDGRPLLRDGTGITFDLDQVVRLEGT